MNNLISDILNKKNIEKEDIITLLSITNDDDIEFLREAAFKTLIDNCGNKVYYRGLVEFSNHCVNDCLYCGIRKSNGNVNRYFLEKEQILDAARFCANEGYGSLVLQSGERHDDQFISFIEDIVLSIKKETLSATLPQGLGITLCIGEQSREAYHRLFDAGAHRYLLRIETTNPKLYAQIHPEYQHLDNRIECLRNLKEIGFQVGTGVMIGLPGQTISDLADDILFFRDMDIGMIGMGPYIVHSETPMNLYKEDVALRRDDIFSLSLKMIAVTRLVLRDVNIASTTALQAMDEVGREKGLQFGANIIMPQVTPTNVRHDYLLYEGKPCLDESVKQCRKCLENRILSLSREIGYDSWGDSKHYNSMK